MENSGTQNKKRIAFTSVMAAIFLTTFKLLIGTLTGSLGILSEAIYRLISKNIEEEIIKTIPNCKATFHIEPD